MCRKPIRKTSRQAVFLFNTPTGEVWVCNVKCLDDYNGLPYDADGETE